MGSFRVGITAAVAVSTAVLMSACGGGEPTASGPTSSTTSSTTTPSSTTSSTTSTTTTTTKAPPPLSKFEGQAPVKGLRAWAAAYAKAINANDETYKSAASTLTPAGLRLMSQVDGSDVGFYYPGPLPFTPVSVKTSGSTSTVGVCMLAKGFAQNRKTKVPAQEREIYAGDFTMVVSKGRWKLDNIVGTPKRDCSKTKIKGVAW